MLTAKHTNHFCALNYYNYCKWNCTLCSTYLYSSIPQHFIVYRTLSHISIHRSIHLKWTEEEDVILKIMRRLENQQNCTYWAFLKLFFLYIYISPSKPQAENSLLLKHISESWGKKKKREREREKLVWQSECQAHGAGTLFCTLCRRAVFHYVKGRERRCWEDLEFFISALESFESLKKPSRRMSEILTFFYLFFLKVFCAFDISIPPDFWILFRKNLWLFLHLRLFSHPRFVWALYEHVRQ